MVMKNLPPLYALRAFEATSRHLSAKQAAVELFVTPAAISHQIKALESFLGVQLFTRLNRQLLLTNAGQKYAASIQGIFNHLITETKKLKANTQSFLTISVEPAFAMYWLIPRLHKFKQFAPTIELRILSSYDIIDFKSSSIDAGIRWGKGQYPGLSSLLLFRNEGYPVCSPTLLKIPLHNPNKLKHYTLLHETAAIAEPDYPDWQSWLKAVDASEVDSTSGLFFETGYLLIQAALDGQGVALERAALVEPAIKTGRLIKAFNFSITESLGGYYLVFPDKAYDNPKINIFHDWLKKELI